MTNEELQSYINNVETKIGSIDEAMSRLTEQKIRNETEIDMLQNEMSQLETELKDVLGPDVNLENEAPAIIEKLSREVETLYNTLDMLPLDEISNGNISEEVVTKVTNLVNNNLEV